MIEKEIKILEIDKESVIKKLEELKAKKNFECVVETHYFDFKENDLEKINGVIRVRRVGNKEWFMDLKIKLNNKKFKTSEETRVMFKEEKDYYEAIEFFQKIGMKERFKLIKKRTSYTFNECFVEIDEIKGIPNFLEIEGREDNIRETRKILGLENNKSVNWDTFELLKSYGIIGYS